MTIRLFFYGLLSLPALAMAQGGLSSPPSAEPASIRQRAAIVLYLRANLGEPYKLGAEDAPKGFDCSGLVQRAYESAGVEVPRTAEEQFEASTPVAVSELEAGDLLFFRMGSGRQKHLHVIVYVGEEHAIHASIKHDAVREIELDQGPWSEDFLGARRLLKAAPTGPSVPSSEPKAGAGI